MGAKAGVSVEEYLHTSFPDLDREYRDGKLLERSLPDYLHGKTQLLLAAFFAALRKRLAIFPCTETRMKIRTGRYAIPDLAVFWPEEPSRVPETPPLVVIEILSLDDRLAEVRDKLEEYKAWGVAHVWQAHVWLVDPHSRRLYACESGLIEMQRLKISELGVELTGADIFE
jgi:Uma2 family endonuclease